MTGYRGQVTGYRGQVTEDRLQITEAPSYNKCRNLEILQDNSKALAVRCLEDWFLEKSNDYTVCFKLKEDRK